MRHTLAMLLVIVLSVPALAAEPVALGDWAKLTVPEKYTTGEAFAVTVELLKVDAPTKMVVAANWMKDRQFGGFLQTLAPAKDVTEPGKHTFNFTIAKTKPGLTAAVITVYLSPDGTWGSKTQSGVAQIPLAKAGTMDMDELGTQSEKTPKTGAFSLQAAPKLPSLAEGGFAAEPGFQDDFDAGWPKGKPWQVATWQQNRTQMSPERCKVDGKGHLVQTVLAGLPGQGGSVQSTREFSWGRWVARVKPTSVPGILNSIFTKDWDDLTTPDNNSDGKKGEIDIELLSYTYGPSKGQAHLAIHLEGRPNLYSVDVPLDFNPSDDFHEWGFDVLPDRVVWHVDGRVLAVWEYTEKDRIDPNYEMFFNSWTMEKWIKGPPKDDGHYMIDSVKFYPLANAAPAASPAAPRAKSGRNAFSQFPTWPQGEDFFPIGVWAQSPRDAGKYKDIGVNFYYALHGGPTEAQMQELRKYGMAAVCSLNSYARETLLDEPLIWGWMHSDEPDLAHVYSRDKLKAPGGKEIIKEHWPEIYKELDLDNNEYNGWGMGAHPINDVQADYKKIKAQDPKRPVFLQLSKAVALEGKMAGRGDRSGKTWEYPLYIQGSDAVTYDIYPVANGSPDKLWLVGKGLDQLKAWGSADRPLMMILEGGFGETYANEHQMRAEAWLSINHGASGIVWFVHRWSKAGGTNKLVSTRMPLTDAAVGKAVKAINEEIQRLAPVINTPAVDGAVSAERVELDLAARKTGGALYVFAVERGGKSGQATLKLTDVGDAKVDVLGENRTLTCTGGQFTDAFDAWSVHLYKITAGE